MAQIICRVVCISLCVAMFVSCAPRSRSDDSSDISDEHKDHVVSGLLGAATGAAIVSGGDPGAVATGALSGAVVGWAFVKLTQYPAEQTSTADQAAQVVGYTESQGTLVRIRGANVTPERVQAGETITFEMEYVFLAPSDGGQVFVQETREIWKDDNLLYPPPYHGPGPERTARARRLDQPRVA